VECLSENTAAEFVQGLLPEEESQKVEAHLDTCAICLRVISELARSSFESTQLASPPSAAAPASPTTLRRGSRVGRYRIEEMIGAGAMGFVYAAYDDELARRVAIKVVRSTPHAQADIRPRLLREARAVASVTHPNVVVVYDVGTVAGDVFVAMELIEGGSFRSFLAERPRGWREVLGVLLRAGRGIAAAHQANVIHRDVKPENILVAKSGRIVVADFGLARTSVDPGSEVAAKPTSGSPEDLPALDPTVTAAGTVLGTPAYMSPEQRRGEPCDARSDQFSFCVVLYEALFGERPHDPRAGRSPKIRVDGEEAARSPHGSPGRKEPHVPLWLRRVVLRGLHPNPGLRYPTMDALVAALSRDPGVVWRRALGVGVVLACLLVAVLAVRRSAARQSRACDDAAHAIDATWNTREAHDLRDAFDRTGVSYAGATWKSVGHALDAYATKWSTMRAEVCTAGLRGGSAELLARREACLQVRRDELDAQLQVLAHADAKIVQNALPAVEALVPIARCTEAHAFEGPSDAQQAAVAVHVRSAMARAWALRNAGKARDALAIATSLAAEADALDSRALQGQAYLVLGFVQSGSGDAKSAVQSLLHAAAFADAAGDDRTRARAWLQLIYDVGYEQAQYDAVPLYDQEARSALERLGGDDDLDAQRRSHLGLVLEAQGKLSEARVELEAALAKKRALFSPGADELGITLTNLGTVLRQQDQEAAAIGAFQEALQIHQATRGDEAPIIALERNDIGDALARQGHFEQALDQCNRAVALGEQQLGPDHPNVAVYLGTRAEALSGLGRYADAYADDRRAMALIQKRFGEASPRLIPFLTGLSRASLGIGQTQDAAAAAEQATALWHVGIEPTERAGAEFALARALHSAGRDSSRAQTLARDAQEVYRAAGDSRELREVTEWIDASLGPRHP